MKDRWQKLQGDKANLVSQAQKVQSEMDALKASYDALIADIPEPTPPPP